jgi:hypothetical protein
MFFSYKSFDINDVLSSVTISRLVFLLFFLNSFGRVIISQRRWQGVRILAVDSTSDYLLSNGLFHQVDFTLSNELHEGVR